ncbi:MAG: CvpA family protein [Candidatus Omnitrophica bacterium]|nr:CvpA family protein [Candidatus Omnitrophota bacterium]
MEWVWQLFDNFKKSSVYPLLQKFSTGDWLLFFAVLWGMAIGIKKGASDMFAKVFGLLLTGVLVLSFYEALAVSLAGLVPALPAEVARPIAFLLLTAFIWFSVHGVINLIGKFFHVESHGAFRSVGGMLLGGFYFLLLTSLAAQFLLFIPSGGLQRYFSKEHSISGTFVASLLPRIKETIAGPLLKEQSKTASSHKTATS